MQEAEACLSGPALLCHVVQRYYDTWRLRWHRQALMASDHVSDWSVLSVTQPWGLRSISCSFLQSDSGFSGWLLPVRYAHKLCHHTVTQKFIALKIQPFLRFNYYPIYTGEHTVPSLHIMFNPLEGGLGLVWHVDLALENTIIHYTHSFQLPVRESDEQRHHPNSSWVDEEWRQHQPLNRKSFSRWCCFFFHSRKCTPPAELVRMNSASHRCHANAAAVAGPF